MGQSTTSSGDINHIIDLSHTASHATEFHRGRRHHMGWCPLRREMRGKCCLGWGRTLDLGQSATSSGDIKHIIDLPHTASNATEFHRGGRLHMGCRLRKEMRGEYCLGWRRAAPATLDLGQSAMSSRDINHIIDLPHTASNATEFHRGSRHHMGRCRLRRGMRGECCLGWRRAATFGLECDVVREYQSYH